MSRFRKILVSTLVAVMALLSVPASSQTQAELDRLREERRQIQEDKAEKAASIDATTAEIAELVAALEILNADVQAKELRVADSQRSLERAKARLAEAKENVTLLSTEIEGREKRLAVRAVSSWFNHGMAAPLVIESEDPTKASRMQSLVGTVTGNEADLANELRELKEDLDIERSAAIAANTKANTVQARLRIELSGLEEAKTKAQELSAAADARLDHLLSEKASLDSIDSRLAKEIVIKEDELKEIWRRAAEDGITGPDGEVTSPDDIVEVQGIYVHINIAAQVDALITAAKNDGIILKGGGYRNSTKQIQLRIAHCGPTDYDIWTKPPGQCRPPTARPGRSLHERGLAIDFTHNGRAINTRSSEAYKWLKANAADYGLYNLPSEPWHWSTTGS